MSHTSKNNSSSEQDEYDYNYKYKKCVLSKVRTIKESCKNKDFLKDDFLEIYSHLINIIDLCENKRLRSNVKRELLKIKKCCDENCNCIYRSERFLKIYDDLILIINKNISKFDLDNKLKENFVKKPYIKESYHEEEEIKEEIIKEIVKEVIEEKTPIKEDAPISKNEIEIPKEEKIMDENRYESKVYKNNSYVLELDYDKNIKVETDYFKNFPTINDKQHAISSNYDYNQGQDLKHYDELDDEGEIDDDEIDDDEPDYDFMSVFAYIYNLGKQSIKPGASASFDQKPIINSVPDAVLFKEPSSIVVNESGVYDLLYFAQTEEKNINLALYINDNEIEETCANTTSYSNTLCSQGLILIPEEETPVTITLRNIDDESDAVFNKSLRSGEVNLSILIRKIS